MFGGWATAAIEWSLEWLQLMTNPPKVNGGGQDRQRLQSATDQQAEPSVKWKTHRSVREPCEMMMMVVVMLRQ